MLGANGGLQLAPLRAVMLVLSALLAGGRYALAGRCWAAFSKEEFTHCAALGPNDTYALHWKVVNGSSIRFGVHVNSLAPDGWVGLGISEAGGMKGSDMAVVYQDDDAGSWVVEDMWSTKFAKPMRDTQQDFKLLNVSVAPTPTSSSSTPTSSPPAGLVAVFERPLTTCDPNDQDMAITPGTSHHVAWAYGTGWPAYHGPTTRGDTRLVLVPDTTTKAVTGMSPDEVATARTADLRMPNITVSPDHTSYMCAMHEVPSDARYHIVRYEPLAGSQLVHHMILFACGKPQKVDGTVFECSRMNADCSKFTISWAPGVGEVDFPPEVGVAVGKGAITHFALQVHYNNPALVSGRVDASGFRLTLTTRLRPHNLGILTLGQTVLQLPPGQAKVVAAPSVCPPSCTSRFPVNLTLLTSGLHMHGLGSTIITRHYRGGVELEPIGQRRAWDFNYQQGSPVAPSTRTLMPGDSLVTQCTYDTTTRTNVTVYGEDTRDEMCFNFVAYYPEVPVELCMSVMDNATAVCGTQAQLSNVMPAFNRVAQMLQSTRMAQALQSSSKPVQAPVPRPGSEAASSVLTKVMMGRMRQQGTLVDAMWPVGVAPYQDPKCPAQVPSGSKQGRAAASMQPTVEAASRP